MILHDRNIHITIGCANSNTRLVRFSRKVVNSVIWSMVRMERIVERMIWKVGGCVRSSSSCVDCSLLLLLLLLSLLSALILLL
jgi:hypothetical protein